MPIRIPDWLRPRGGDRSVSDVRPDVPMSSASAAALSTTFSSATNAARPVIDLVRPHLQGGEALIVTGYQDFLSAMAILLREVPGLGIEESDKTIRPPRIRMVFGIDTSTSRRISGHKETPGEEASRRILERRGLWVEDATDLRAILAIDAIRARQIELRVFDPARAKETMGITGDRRLHAKLVVSPLGAIQGSANFSRAGLYSNIEYADNFAVPTGLATDDAERAAIDRQEEAERIWDAGVDWSTEAIDILERLLKPVTAEDAIARTIAEQRGFEPWRRPVLARPPLQYQADLIYEANAIVYEHGFALVEAPAGAGKTDIGKHLATAVSDTFERTVRQGAPDRIQKGGALVVAPARVLGNWQRGAPRNLQVRSVDVLARQKGQTVVETDGLTAETPLEAFAALILDESHTVVARGETVSARAEAIGLAPPGWTVGLSATLLGNGDLDWLAHLKERRASLYMSPAYLAKMRDLFERDRDRRLDLSTGSDLRAAPLTEVARDELADLLAPFLAVRLRSCVGERAEPKVVAGNVMRFPSFEFHDRPAALERKSVAHIVAEIVDRLATLDAGARRASRDTSRLGVARVQAMGERDLHARNLLNVLRSSSALALWEMREGMLGQKLRTVERYQTRERESLIKAGQLDLFPDDVEATARTPICDAIESALAKPAVQALDTARADGLRKIQACHGRVIVLAERIGTLRHMAQLLGTVDEGTAGTRHVCYVCASGTREDDDFLEATTGTGSAVFKTVASGEQLEKLFRPGGRAAARATAFLTYAMAEGINLQSADALVLLGVTSNLTHLVQGLGRIDRIDSPHAVIHYHPFDTPTPPLASDAKAFSRLARRERLAGAGVEGTGESAIVKAIERSLCKPRVLRHDNYHDRLELMWRSLDPERAMHVAKARIEGLWGARLALVAPGPVTILHLRGEEEPGRFAPPRLLAIRSNGLVIRNQIDCAAHLHEAWTQTYKAETHRMSPSPQDLVKALDRLMTDLARLRAWHLRPERTTGLLRGLATFLAGEGTDDADADEAMFGELSLLDLEVLCEAFTARLAPYWREEKERIRASFLDGADYLSLADVLDRLRADESAAESARDEMQELLEQLRLRSVGDESGDHVAPGVADRVAVAFIPSET